MGRKLIAATVAAMTVMMLAAPASAQLARLFDALPVGELVRRLVGDLVQVREVRLDQHTGDLILEDLEFVGFADSGIVLRAKEARITGVTARDLAQIVGGAAPKDVLNIEKVTLTDVVASGANGWSARIGDILLTDPLLPPASKPFDRRQVGRALVLTSWSRAQFDQASIDFQNSATGGRWALRADQISFGGLSRGVLSYASMDRAAYASERPRPGGGPARRLGHESQTIAFQNLDFRSFAGVLINGGSARDLNARIVFESAFIEGERVLLGERAIWSSTTASIGRTVVGGGAPEVLQGKWQGARLHLADMFEAIAESSRTPNGQAEYRSAADLARYVEVSDIPVDASGGLRRNPQSGAFNIDFKMGSPGLVDLAIFVSGLGADPARGDGAARIGFFDLDIADRTLIQRSMIAAARRSGKAPSEERALMPERIREATGGIVAKEPQLAPAVDAAAGWLAEGGVLKIRTRFSPPATLADISAARDQGAARFAATANLEAYREPATP